ncbi:DNA replication/repair protein RecF [Leptolyngbya sp. FACHB-261]|uniref:DNA replication/repair protein RecF n=1 Tax=Leptolyngbya sp. FACHB-261 TaxID=2692806 RepID=UPI001685B7F4|nr:DNA replication/repair protein RecF [Leptolyngbya sp. FACHB-261]MBD2103154.1 DNA replication/repair protein RecF [Leptolyngbya sp. FACHB-261]
MYLKSLHLRQFRNYQDQAVRFFAPKTVLVGDNAQGKSNLLEAVELLATLRSHRCTRDRDLVRQEEEAAQLQAELERLGSAMELGLILRSNGRRTARLNGETLRRQLDFLGNLNAVLFSSLDLDLVRGGPEGRRVWLDTVLVQLEPIYAHILQQYAQALRQRNALLRQGETDRSQLVLWDAQLATTGARVTRRRARLLTRLAPLACRWHASISGQSEALTVQYTPRILHSQPELNLDDPVVVQQAFLDEMQSKAEAEWARGTSLVGPHRDEVTLTINETPARAYGSQGQQRTLVLALKLAELELIEAVVGEPPLLLLDDVLAELDLRRQNQLLDAIQDRVQTIITTTHLGSFDAQWLTSAQVMHVQAGRILA